MSLPLPRYTSVGLDAYLETVPVVLPLPPGPPSTWTCALHLFGPALLLATDDQGTTLILDHSLLQVILGQLGRPVLEEEQEVLLWVSPLPKPSGSLVELLVPLLDHVSYGIRWHVALLLGRLGDSAAVPHLLRKLDDDDNDVRRGVVEALGRLGDPSVIPALAARSWGDSDPSVDAARVLALVRLDDWESVAIHVEEDEDEAAYGLVRAILEARVSGDASEVIEVLSEGDEHLTRAVIAFLRTRPELAVGQAEELIRPLVEDEGAGASVELALSAGLGGEEVIDPLLEVLETGEWRARMFAAMGLGSLDPSHLEAVQGPLMEHLSDDDNDVRRESALALVRLGHVVPEVEQVLSRESSSEYHYGWRAAEVSHGSKALESLSMLFGDAPPDERLLGAMVGSGREERERGLMALLLALADPAQFYVLLDAMARDDHRDVPLFLRRACAAALLLTGFPPESLGAVHRILLCHQGEADSFPKAPVDGLAERHEELLLLACKDGDWPVRIDALRLLQLTGQHLAHLPAIEHIARHDPDVDCRQQAKSLLPPRWAPLDGPHRLAQVLVGTATEDALRLSSFRALVRTSPSLGLALSTRFLASDDRDMAREAARIVGSMVSAEQVPEAVGGALGRLAGGWVQREAAVDLLGHIPVELYEEGLLEEVVEILRDRVESDEDDDVQAAAKASLARLGSPWEE